MMKEISLYFLHVSMIRDVIREEKWGVVGRSEWLNKNAIDGGWKPSDIGGTPSKIIKILIDPLISIEMSALSSGHQAIEEQIFSTFKFIR